jgi:hypothetical protein
MIAALLLNTAACGKKGALLYPDMLVPDAVTSVVTYQSGASVKLLFNVPENDRAGRKLADLAGVRISRQVQDALQEQACRTCLTDYQLFRTLYLDLLPEGTHRSGNRILYVDGEITTGKRYSYSLVPFTKGGISGPASNPTATDVIPALPPPVIQAESFPTEIKLTFPDTPPEVGSLVGYNLYRTTTKGEYPLMPINREAMSATVYLDSRLQRGVRYYYSARALVKLGSGAVVESRASNEVEGILKDDE